jgi:hypothetical protein
MAESLIQEDSFKVEAPNAWKPWLIASIAAIAILGIALGLMEVLGLFDIPKEDAGTKTLAAAFALVGSVLASVLTLVGTVVKYSIDDRNARLASVEASRNYALALEAEKRNRIEAAIRAVDLLCENNRDTTENQMGGALLALVSLGELDLAVTLLAQLWPKSLKSPEVAEVVLEAVLESGSKSAQISAASLLRQNAEHLQQPDYYIWPLPDLQWRTDLPGNCRMGLAQAAGRWLKIEILKDRQRMPSAAVVLFQVLSDPDGYIRDIAVGALRPLTLAFPASLGSYYGDNIGVSIKDIADRLGDFQGQLLTQQAFDLESEIRDLLGSKAGAGEAPNPGD